MSTGKPLDINKLKQQELLEIQDAERIPDSFFDDHMSMVESLASGIVSAGKVPPCIEFNDLVSWGCEGLIKAKKGFKEGKGSSFKTYAYYRIRGEMLDKVRSEWQYRNPGDYDSYRTRIRQRITELAGEQIKTDELDGNNIQENVHSLIENSGMVYMLSSEDCEIISDKPGMKNPEIEHVDESDSVLWEEIQGLDEDEREVVDLFYIKGMKQVEIAERLNYSRSKVCRIHMSILNKLRNRLHKRYNED
jgi:RNA polymerase sigma factor (sigma-70 family)